MKAPFYQDGEYRERSFNRSKEPECSQGYIIFAMSVKRISGDI